MTHNIAFSRFTGMISHLFTAISLNLAVLYSILVTRTRTTFRSLARTLSRSTGIYLDVSLAYLVLGTFVPTIVNIAPNLYDFTWKLWRLLDTPFILANSPDKVIASTIAACMLYAYCYCITFGFTIVRFISRFGWYLGRLLRGYFILVLLAYFFPVLHMILPNSMAFANTIVALIDIVASELLVHLAELQAQLLIEVARFPLL